MASVTIEYCVPCGHRERALAAANVVLDAHANAVDDVRLVPGEGGIFEVRVDDDVVLDTDVEGYDHDVVVDRVGERVADATA